MRIERVNAFICLVLVGCVNVTTTTIGQKTSLEKQLMGEFEPLTDEELLAASVRSPGGLSSLQSRAIAARRRQLFNRDDVLELKSQGCVGESTSGMLVERPCEAQALEDLRRKILEQEADDRNTIIDWVIASDTHLTPKDRQHIVALYYQMQKSHARAGDLVQLEDGTWTKQ